MFTALSNGSAACDDPAALQEICARLQPGTIGATRPALAAPAAPAAGSMRQIEVSRTIVFDAPRHACGFFEALVADNLDIGRPHKVEIIFGRRIRRETPGTFRTATDRRDNGGVLVNLFYKHSQIKEYLKDGRPMRIEAVVNFPVTSAATPASPTWTSSRPRPAPPTGAYGKPSPAGQGHRPCEPSL